MTEKQILSNEEIDFMLSGLNEPITEKSIKYNNSFLGKISLFVLTILEELTFRIKNKIFYKL